MSYAEALEILANPQEQYYDSVVYDAIVKILSMETINACRKETLVKTIRWLMNKLFSDFDKKFPPKMC